MEVERLGALISKKWSSTNLTYDRSENLDRITSKTKNLSETYDITWYLINKKFRFVTYVRNSKTNGQPCIHQEWRISGSTIIRQKTGIAYMNDLASLNLETLFEGLLEKFISYDSIDRLRLGKWIFGMGGRTKPNKEKRLYIRGRATVFCRVENIKTFADLKQHINKRKKELKKKGRRSKWDEKYIKCDPNKFKVKLN